MTSLLKNMLALDPSREQVEAWCRARTQVIPAGEDRLLCRVLGQYLMYVHARDYALTPHLAMNGIWEPWITMAIARHLKPGMRCMDVGACYGYYSLLMADIVGKEGYVEAWEPVWNGFVRDNVDMNGLVVNDVQAALGTAAVEEEFPVDIPMRSMFNAGDISGVSNETGRRELRAYYLTPVPRTYDFIKIDVEGSEADVWEALSGVREASPNLTVCMEFTPMSHGDSDGVLAGFMEDGFKLGSVGHDGVPRPCSVEEALVPDTGDFRMLWLTRQQ